MKKETYYYAFSIDLMINNIIPLLSPNIKHKTFPFSPMNAHRASQLPFQQIPVIIRSFCSNVCLLFRARLENEITQIVSA